MSHRLEVDADEAVAHAAPAPRRRPIKTLLLFVALLCVTGGAWWGYRSRALRLPPAAVPVIHSDAAPVKEAPKNPGGMIVPDQESALLNRDGKGAPKVEQLLPEPEPVLPRPVAAPKPVPPAETSAAPSKSESPPAPPLAAVAPPPVSAPAPPPSAVAVAPAAPPVPAAAPPAVSAPPQIASGPSYRLQLGAVRSQEAAEQEWQKLKRAQPDLLAKLSLTTTHVDLGERGIYYRIQAGPIADAAEAAQSCATLKSRNVGCILVKP